MRVPVDPAPAVGRADHASTLEVIPAELTSLPQWVCWHYETRNGQQTKPPIQAKSNGKLLYARSNDPTTWTTFDDAIAAVVRLNLSGQGLCLSPTDNLTGLDLDHVFNPATGALEPLAIEVLERFAGTYTELSPSGTGFRIFCYGKPGRTGKCAGKLKWLEVYSHPSHRYLTVTGNHWAGAASAVTEQQDALDWLHHRFMGKGDSTERRRSAFKGKGGVSTSVDSSLDDAALLDKAHKARNSALFAQLWSGDKSPYHGDDSAADLALCNLLAFWTGNDSHRIDSLFRQSGLFRGKWDELRGELTYGQMRWSRFVGQDMTGLKWVSVVKLPAGWAAN